LFDDLTTLPGVWFDVYTGLLVAGLLAGLYVYLRRRPLSRGLTPRRHLLRATSQWVMWICAIGLFFGLMRYIEMPYLDKRIYSYLVIFGAIVYIGSLTRFLSEIYPVQVYNFDQHQSSQRYRSTSKRRPQPAAAPASGRPAIQRGKRRR
jgi:uncharacterized iron-regulated membrane protein